MFIRQSLGGFQFDDQPVINHQIGEVIANTGSVFVENPNGMLLLDVDPGFAQAVSQGGFIHFLQVTMPMINVNGISGLTDEATQFVDGFHGILEIGFAVIGRKKKENHWMNRPDAGKATLNSAVLFKSL